MKILNSLITFLLSLGAVYAAPMPADQAVLRVPDKAVEVAPFVFSLGTATDPGTGKIVEGFMILHPKKDAAKPSNPGNKPGGTGEQCYALMASGAKWKTSENYLVDALGSNLYPSAIQTTISAGIAKWESAAGVDIFGDETSGTVNGVDESAPDTKNEVTFGPIAESNTIAVTIVWGRFSGPVSQRYLAEWDQLYNTNFPWSITGDTNAMDFDNIATHELGHAFGLSHPNSTCTAETMYAYAALGETKKQTLEAGDIAGINALY